jgi:hypothetical protein
LRTRSRHEGTEPTSTANATSSNASTPPQPPPPEGGRIAAVGRASLRAELTNALERNRWLTVRVRQLEPPLPESLGENTLQESGLDASADIDQLQRRITLLEQDLAGISGQLDERTEELDAARAANRKLPRALNQVH